MRLGPGAAGIKYKGRTDVLLALFDKGTTVRGRADALEVSLGAGRVVPGEASIRQGARAGRKLRQRKCVHRQNRPRGDDIYREARRAGFRLQAD